LGWSKLKDKARIILLPLVKMLSFMPPNVITFIGLLIVIFASYLILKGNFREGGLVLIVGSILDAVDGQIARIKGKTSKFGAFFDSTLDRYAEFFIFFAIAFSRVGTLLVSALSFATILGAYLTSYTRARAESLGIEIREGFFTRVERLVIIIIGLIILSNYLVYIMIILAIGSNLTAIQRILIAYKRFEKGGI
jgi:CDP-diacylglycerol--glycerol-3-phosphate 3-phosphatidyltransferase